MQTSSPAADASGPPLTPQSTTVTPWAAPSARISSTVSVGMVLTMTAVLPGGRAGEHAVGPLEDGPDLGVVEDHDEDHVAPGGQLRGCRRHVGPLPVRVRWPPPGRRTP